MSVLQRIIDSVRLATNESLIDNKYTDNDIIDMMRQVWPVILSEVNRMSKNPIIIRHQISIGPNTSSYILPPHVGEVLFFVNVDTTTGMPLWELRPRSLWNPYGPEVHFEGNILKLIPTQQVQNDLELWYIPNGDISPVVGTVSSVATTGEKDLKRTTLTLNTTATKGSFEKVTNAYSGYVLDVEDGDAGGHTERRMVQTSSVSATGETLVVIKEDYVDFTPASGDVVELIPMVMTRRLEHAITLYVARVIFSYEEMPGRVRLLDKRCLETLRSLRLDVARFENRVGGRMSRDTADNPYFALSGNIWSW